MPWRSVPDDGYRDGRTVSKKTAHGTILVTINDHPDDNQPYECIINGGKSGQEVTAMMEALGRTISYVLQIPSPVPPKERIEALAGKLANIGGQSNGMGPNRITSAPDGVSKALFDYLQRVSSNNHRPEAHTSKSDLCPQCKAPTLQKGGNCDICTACGYSKC